jgi:alkylated DNA repair dioxygenase AlkB
MKMDLFSNAINSTTNLLPGNGSVNYYGKIISRKDADHFFNYLMNGVQWSNDQAVIYGKLITTKRKVAWYGDRDFEYTYSNITKQALAWTKELHELKTIVENQSGEKFNTCLLNLYHTGAEGMGWHSDAEKDLKKDGAIGSLSFGAERKFLFRHKQTEEIVPVMLEHGSLLIMKDTTQTHWLHRLPPTKLINQPRINLTFRTISDK